MNANPFTAVKTLTDHADDCMNQVPVILFAITYGVLACSGQTDSPAPRHWFSLPAPLLRPLPPTSDASKSVLIDNQYPVSLSLYASQPARKPLLLAETQFADSPTGEIDLAKSSPAGLLGQMSLHSPLGDADLRTYRRFEENGYLKRPPAKSDNAFVRVANNIFEPTPIRIGKTTVVCSLITAIKKKNPLCLLNPMVLSISW